MYNIEGINDFLNNISSKYNKEVNSSLYDTKYSLLFDKKNIIQKIKLIRENPNTNLIFNNLESRQKINEDNEIDIIKKSDNISYSTNDINLYNTSNYSDKQYYHYITYNNTVHNEHPMYVRKFDLFRIKFNISIIKPIIEIDGKIKEKFNIPSEFVDVSIPSFSDINRKNFYNEIQEEGINILNYSQSSTNYFWNTYSIHQLFDDLVNILFGPTIIPWYDAKYDKRIIRLLLLFSFYKIEKTNCNWICFLTDILKLTNKLYIYTQSKDIPINDEFFLTSIKPFILGPKSINVYDNEKSKTILNYTLDNIYYKLNNLGYNHIIKIDEYYKDFELIIRFLIFYSYSMKKYCFTDVFNNIRQLAGLLPYEPGKTRIFNDVEYNIIDYNNLKFIELLKVISNTICVLLFFLNETNDNCGFKNLINCKIKEIKVNCSYVNPIKYNFDSYEFKYYNNIVEKKNKNNKSKKYIIINNK